MNTELDHIEASERERWRTLVGIAVSCSDEKVPAVAAEIAPKFGSMRDSMVRKIQAVRHLARKGKSSDEIVELGQSQTLSIAASDRYRAFGPQRILSYRVSKSIADLFECEHPAPGSPEPVVTRLHRVCGITTADDLLDFISAIVEHASDEELRHHAGMYDFMRRCRKVSG